MKTAIIGLPMTGKTSLFTILTGVHQETRIGSTAVRTGIAKVPDARLEALAKLFEPNKTTFATVEYVDMPSISKETLRDPGAMASLRNVDAFAHVLRLFADQSVPHEKGSVDPLRDMEDLETELILSDFVVIEKRLERLDKAAATRNPPYELGVIAGCRSLGAGRLITRLPGPNDGVVTVEETCVPNARDEIVLNVGHSEMLLSAELVRQACAFLRHGHFLRTQAQEQRRLHF